MLKESLIPGQCENALKSEVYTWRQSCKCIKTSQKLKKILSSFPPPLTPSTMINTNPYSHMKYYRPQLPEDIICCKSVADKKKISVSWQVILEIVQLVQLSVTATALGLYYLIYCYMQLIYYTLRSALYFHNADFPMKIAIGVVTITSILVAFNLIIKVERIIGIIT